MSALAGSAEGAPGNSLVTPGDRCCSEFPTWLSTGLPQKLPGSLDPVMKWEQHREAGGGRGPLGR